MEIKLQKYEDTLSVGDKTKDGFVEVRINEKWEDSHYFELTESEACQLIRALKEQFGI